MKKTVITTIIFICTLYTVNAQQRIDNIQLKCTYKYDYTYSGLRFTNKMVDTMMLEIGSKSCKFYSYHNYLVNLIRKNSDPSTWMLYKSTPNKYTIYFNYPENKTTVIDHAVGTLKDFEYIEDLEIPKWTVYKETQTILSHTCKKATCRFRGRDYVAWYAIDIPISRGPYKFAGLPGLILKISDTENLYSFECIGMEKTNALMYKEKKKGVETVSVTREEFYKIEKRYYENPNAIFSEFVKDVNLENLVEQIKKARNVDIPNNAMDRYNPIELE